jgi:aspartyl/asparaginyl beta-hydroxylase (cupin superfamily)
LASLLQKGALIEGRGDARNAARAYRNALATIPPGATPVPALSAMVDRARRAVRADDEALAGALDEQLAAVRAKHGSASFGRVDHCLDMLTGRRARYNPEPTFMYFPEIPAVEFFERGDFPWLDAVEAATDAIRSELTTILVADRAGLEPYIAYPDGVPLDRWRELNKSRRWSAYFLANQGVEQPSHIARCPLTMRALEGVPLCDVGSRAPTIFFSILDASTQIPPHSGVTNTRLTVHLPLIVPANCGFRVGSETREWVPGKAWVFDDTIEHEAWNRSDTPRAILIFDIWNPYLSAAERDVVRAATEVVGKYYASTPETAA